MKTLPIIILICSLALLTIGCKTETVVVEKPVEKVVVVEKQVPPSTIPEQPLLNEDKPSPHVSVEEDPKGHIKEDTAAEEKHLYKVEESQKVVEVVPENKTGRETVYVMVELKNFNDPDLLDQVRNRILETAHNNNYKVTTEREISRKHMILKVWSELPGPISLHQTLQNSLNDYDVKISQTEEHLMIIMPR